MLPPHAYFVGSAVFHYLGPSFAVLLFARVAPLGVAWLRIASAALVFALWRRPWRAWAGADPAGRGLIVGFAAVLALMNASFYLAIDRLPLGMVAAIEFVGPVLLASVGARSARNIVAVAAAAAGVYLLTHVRLEGEPLGVLFAFANAALFTGYIVLAHQLSRRRVLGGIDGLALAMLVSLVFISPLAMHEAAPAFTDSVALAAGVGVGISSSLIPYVCDQLAMARMPRATYALFVSLLPAVATVIGVVVLGQVPSVADLVGIALVIGAVAVHQPDPADQTDRAMAPPLQSRERRGTDARIRRGGDRSRRPAADPAADRRRPPGHGHDAQPGEGRRVERPGSVPGCRRRARRERGRKGGRRSEPRRDRASDDGTRRQPRPAPLRPLVRRHQRAADQGDRQPAGRRPGCGREAIHRAELHRLDESR